jgi:hypothetical protein
VIVDEWDEYGQGHRSDGRMVVCICGEYRRDADWSDHFCPYDVRPCEACHATGIGGPDGERCISCSGTGEAK